MTNPTLLRAVRERMAAHTTEQLLDLWVTNDRATWSAEAFEAARQILADRGHAQLPPQNEPAPLGRRFRLSDRPESGYWLGWLRPILWLGMAAASVSIASQAVGVLDLAMWGRIDIHLLRYPWALVTGIVRTILMPAWLLVGSVACLRHVPAGRAILFVWALVGTLVGAAVMAVQVWNGFTAARGILENATYGLANVGLYLHPLVLPIILLVFLRRPEIKAAFTAGGAGFELNRSASSAIEGPPITGAT